MGSDALTDGAAWTRSLRVQLIRQTDRPAPPCSAFAGFLFPSEVLLLAVRWCLQFGLSCRDLEELLAERGIDVDHVTVHRRVRRFSPLLVGAAGFCRRPTSPSGHAVTSNSMKDGR
jgi:transposase-like protein